MQKLLIKGKKELNGTIPISGSKNATLPILAASILANAGLKIILLERDFIFGGFSNSSDQKVKNWIKK